MLNLNLNNYEDKLITDEKQTLKYRAFMDIPYVDKPVSDIQKMNIFVPLAYFHDGMINGYTAKTAPIFMPNTVGGYMPGPSDSPENHNFPNNAETIKQALLHGYVVISAGLRGRTLKNEKGEYIGKAPAFIVDMKAAIRFVRHFSSKLPGDTDRIITNGTSAGGATSALTGTSGDAPYFEKYLKEIGAADESDAIFAASCYCPIHNLENADAAYEWEFNGIDKWQRGVLVKPGQPPVFKTVKGELTEEEKELSPILKENFISYLNGLKLKDNQGKILSLNEDGTGSFAEYVKDYIKQSAQKALDEGKELTGKEGIEVKNGQVISIDWDKYLKFITRMKGVPAFDDLDMKNPEPNLFGTTKIDSRHFTKFAQQHSHVDSEIAPIDEVKAVNPLTYIKDNTAKTAKYWRIRHGASDRDTSFAIPIILETYLKNNGYDVDFALPWAKPHSGDYDLRDLFSWIDKICARG